jgi:hypothetical protein
MDGFTVDVGGLDVCQQTLADRAGQFGGIGDNVTQGPTGSSSFGTLPAATRVSQLTIQLSAAAASQFSSAEAFLRAAERALDQTGRNYTVTDSTNAGNATRSV